MNLFQTHAESLLWPNTWCLYGWFCASQQQYWIPWTLQIHYETKRTNNTPENIYYDHNPSRLTRLCVYVLYINIVITFLRKHYKILKLLLFPFIHYVKCKPMRLLSIYNIITYWRCRSPAWYLAYQRNSLFTVEDVGV